MNNDAIGISGRRIAATDLAAATAHFEHVIREMKTGTWSHLDSDRKMWKSAADGKADMLTQPADVDEWRVRMPEDVIDKL